jgi:antitoxin CptB
MNTREENQERDADRLAERHRCYWRSRRGLLELDLLLPPFVKARFDSLSVSQLSALQRLLDCEDQDIWDWFQRRATPGDAELLAIVDLVRAFNDGRANNR